MNREYIVQWEINLYAHSAEDAARKALAIHHDSESLATVFDVTDETGETIRIDLTQIDEESEGRRDVQKDLEKAADDWNTGRAYVDNSGNYRTRQERAHRAGALVYIGKGPIAPWNKLIKSLFRTPGDFHDFAEQRRQDT